MIVQAALKKPCRLLDGPDRSKRQVLLRMGEDDGPLPFP